MASTWRTLPLAAALCAAGAALLGLVRPHAGGAGPGDPGALLHALPGDVDAVVVVADAANQRTSPAGAALASILAETHSFRETAEAWRGLARTLEWTPDQAFDRLLGRRITLVVEDLERGPAARWALFSEVSGPTERRLRARLKPAPRAIVDGLPVLAVENGRYELAISRDRGDGGSTILLSADRALFDRLLPVLAGRPVPDALGDSPALAGARALADGDVFVLVRPPASPRPDAPAAEDRFIALSATLAGDGWTARLVCTPGTLWSLPPRDAAPWSAAAFERLAQDAMVAVMGLLDPEDASFRRVLEGQVWLAPLGLAGHADALDLLGQRGAVVVRPTPAPPDRRHLRARPDPKHLSVILAIETKDVHALAPVGDRAAAALVPVLETGCATAKSDEACATYDGSLPEAVRVVTIESGGDSFGGAFGPTPVLSWGYCASDGRPLEDRARPVGAAPACAGEASAAPAAAPAPPARPGWWVVALSSFEVPAAVVGCEALSDAEPDGAARPRVSLGLVRPARIVRWLNEVDSPLAGPARPLRRVERVRWDVWATPGGLIEGTLEVRLATDGGAR